MWIGTRTDLFELRAPFTHGRPAWYALKVFCFGLNAAWLLFGAMGIVVAWRKHKQLLWLAIPISVALSVYFPFYNCETRYSQPIYPLLLAFSALGIVALRDAVRASTRASAPTPSAAGL